MPDLENNRKNSRKRCRQKTAQRTASQTAEKELFRMLRLFCLQFPWHFAICNDNMQLTRKPTHYTSSILGRIHCIWARWGRFVIFPLLCLLAYGDTALKSEFLLAFEAPKKGCDNDIFRAVFPSIWVSWDPQTLQNKGKSKMTNRPCFALPQGFISSLFTGESLALRPIFWLISPRVVIRVGFQVNRQIQTPTPPPKTH